MIDCVQLCWCSIVLVFNCVCVCVFKCAGVFVFKCVCVMLVSVQLISENESESYGLCACAIESEKIM